ncbi:MAG: cell division protein ZapE [Pseudomonadota bacterium]
MTGSHIYRHSEDRSLTQRYADKLSANDWQTDPAQQQAISQLDTLRDALIDYHTARTAKRWWHLDDGPTAPRGLYLWGGVGRGKTFMMDLFYESLPIPATRSHFHRFMYDVHNSLKQLDGRRDPLPDIARTLASRVSVLCFDEFFVSDIADAMLLGRLTTALFQHGVVLVATSNQPPEDLYKDGLQRARFLPAIEQIALHCDVLHIDHPVDYRLRLLDQAPMYYTPSDDDAKQHLQQRFQLLSEGGVVDEPSVEINGRAIPVIAKAPGVCWFSFDALCRGPRSQNDYIALATRLHTVLLSDVPAMDARDDNAARRFIALVDEFYERKVNLMIAADVGIEDLYVDGKLSFEFERTRSRLIEMQSTAYLSTMRKS